MKKLSRILLAALIVSLLLASSLVAGCDRAPTENEAPKGPVKGGRLSIGLSQEPRILNPYLPDGTLPATKLVTSSVLWGLLVATPDLAYAPRLAQEVPTLENGQVTQDPFTVIYEIKDNATWSDGAPITSQDVKFTWKVIMDPSYPIADRSGYDKIARIDTPYEKTVRIVFNEPYARYKELFSTTHPVLPRHILEGNSLADIGVDLLGFASGPYKFKEWRKGEHLTLVRNEEFWESEPFIDEVTFRFFKDDGSLISGFSSGNVDAIYLPSGSAHVDRLRALEGKRLKADAGLQWEQVGFNLTKSPLDDPNVRRAVAHAIDRQRIAGEAGAGVPVLDGIVSPQAPFYIPAWREYEFDIEKSRAYLEEAGYREGANGIFEKDGKPLVIATSAAQGDRVREVAQLIMQDGLRQAGIRLEVRNTDKDTFLTSWLPEGDFDTAIWAWLAGPEPDLAPVFSAASMPPTGQNYYRYANPDTSEMLRAASALADDAQRHQTYRAVQRRISDDLPTIPLYRHVPVLAYDKRISGIINNTTYEGPFWQLDKWWIAK